MKYFFTIISVIFTITCFAQLNCKTTTNERQEIITTCFHANKTISTLEVWDKDKRSGSVKGFDNQGKQLYHYYLRRFGGHASATISYYLNGQVSRVNYSSAPDGGIQFYKSTIQFDKLGKQTGFSEQKYPPEQITFQKEPIPQKTPQKPTIAECAVPVFDQFEVKNATKSKVTLHIKTKNNPNYIKKEFYLTLKPNENILFDSLVSAQFHPKEEIYDLSIVSYTKKKKQKIIQIGTATNEDKSKNQKTWTWVLF